MVQPVRELKLALEGGDGKVGGDGGPATGIDRAGGSTGLRAEIGAARAGTLFLGILLNYQLLKWTANSIARGLCG